MRGNLKRKIIVNFIVILACFVTSQLSAVEFAGGTGEPNDPYQIATAEQLIVIGNDWNLLDKHFVIVDDIDLDPNLPGGQVFTQAVIAPYKLTQRHGNVYGYPSFSGSLDGNGHSIFNMVMVVSNDRERGGLIGYLTVGAFVEDLHLRNITIRGVGDDVGALVGRSRGKILRCSVTGSITGKYNVGGLVGSNQGDIVSCSAFCNVQSVPGGAVGFAGGLVGSNSGCISNCYSVGIVTGCEDVGGLIGSNGGPSYISNCYAMGTITGSESVGGLVGNNIYGDISNCYATGTVAGEESVGGLIGYLYDYDSTVSKCYSVCEIIADSNDSIGGLIGKSTGQTMNSFWDVQVSGQEISAGGIGLPTAKLQDSETYLNAGWSIASETSYRLTDIWTITEPNTYPQLIRLIDQYPIPQLPGSGTADDPYKIVTTADLVAINDHNNINAHYALVADIDMSGMVWSTAPISFFNGTFDGRGHTISNLTIEGNYYIGLFDKIMTDAVVTNLTIQDANIIGDRYVGALAGVSMGHITNCHVTGNIKGVSFIGGLVGLVRIYYGNGIPTFEDYVSDCTADVVLFGENNVNNIANVHYYD
jgi:hypothetical protein